MSMQTKTVSFLRIKRLPFVCTKDFPFLLLGQESKDFHRKLRFLEFSNDDKEQALDEGLLFII